MSTVYLIWRIIVLLKVRMSQSCFYINSLERIKCQHLVQQIQCYKQSCQLKVKKVKQSTCIAPCIVQTTLKRSGMDHTAFNLQRTQCLPLPRKRSPDGASTECCGEHLIAAHYSFIDPQRMKGWVGLVGWPIADSLSGHPSATGRAQDGERTLARDWHSIAEPHGPICKQLIILGNSCNTSCRNATLDRVKGKVKFSHTHYRALGPELIPVHLQSTRRWLFKSSPCSRLPLLFARPAVTFATKECHCPSTGTKLYCLVTYAT